MFLSTQSESNQMGCTLSLYFNPVLVHQHFLNPVHRISTQLLGHSLHQRIFLDDTIHAWRIAVFYKADLDLQLQLIADVLIVQPVSKRRFGVDNLFDLFRQSLALVVDDSTINLFIGSVFKIILVPQGKENKDKERKFFV